MPAPKERSTRQRRAVQDAIAAAPSPLSAREILVDAKARVRRIGLATVYRTLRLLADAGIIRAVEIPGAPPRYELAGKAHHHHFACRACGKVYEIEGCCGHFNEDLPRGFVLEGHEVVLFGRCAACARHDR